MTALAAVVRTGSVSTARWLPVVLMGSYPLLLSLFSKAIEAYRSLGDTYLAACAGLTMIVAGAIPIVAFQAIMITGRGVCTSGLFTHGVLILCFAGYPLYVLTLLIGWKVGVAEYHSTLWGASWIAVGVALLRKREPRARGPRGAHGYTAQWVRLAHGRIALVLLCSFLALHLINHDLAIWSVDLHQSAMEWLRLWYRSEWLEPLLLTLFLVMLCTGIPLAIARLKTKPDPFRLLQVSTGVYIGFFVCAHLIAVIGARSAEVETDWVFATGPSGLLHLNGMGMLIPYYTWAVFLLIVHVAFGCRSLLLRYGVDEARANKTACVLSAMGLIITIPISIAALGLHVQAA